MASLFEVCRKIEAQQGKSGTPAWMIGLQLRGIISSDPSLVDLVDEDLNTLNLEGCAKAMQAKANELRKETGGRCVCIPPDVAEAVIRKYFGLPDSAGAPAPVPAAIPQQTQEPAANPQQGDSFIDLDTFF